MNNGSMPLKGNQSQIPPTTSTRHADQDTSLDLTDVSILSVGLRHYRQHDPTMLTDDDDDDQEVVETSDDDEDDDDEDDETFNPLTRHGLVNNHHHHHHHHHANDEMDLGLIDPDTQAKLTAILEATGITNAPIPEDFWRDQQVVRLLTSRVTNNLHGLHEIANAINSSTQNPEKKCKSMNKDTSGTFVRACVNNDLRTVEKILQSTHGKDHFHDVNEDGDSVLALACSNGFTDLVQLLLTTIPQIDIDDRGSKQDCTPLMEACNAGHFEIVELLLKHNANVNIQSTSGNTALHYSAGGGYAEIVRLLLEHGAKVEETNENGHTPLMEAASGGHVEVARALLDHGAGVNTHSNESKDKNGTDGKQHKTDEMHTALMEACMDGHVQVAKLLLDHGADVNMPPDSYESPLTLSACGGHIELALLLIERGANLEEVNDEGYTPLMEASREGHDDLVNLLVSRGADVNRTTEDTQETALTLACAGGFIDVAKILISNGGNVNLGQSSPLMEASQEGHTELVQYLIQMGADVNQRTLAGDTALAYACESGHTEVAEILLNAGAQVDQAENEGRTPLMKAARAGHTCTVRYLIGKGADVNRSTDSNDATVLSLACAGGHLELAAILLKHDANPNHLLKDRSNCLIEAAKGGHTAIVQLLLEYPKSVQQRTVNPSNEPVVTEDETPLSASMSSSFPLPSSPSSSSTSPIQLLKSLQKIVPRNILDVLQSESTETTGVHQAVTESINCNPALPSSSTITGKKKRTTSSSSTSSSSSTNSSSSTPVAIKQDEPFSLTTSSLTLPVPSPTIDFFSTPSHEPVTSSSSSLRLSNKTNLPSFHHHQQHSKLKKSFHRHLSKCDRRLEKHLHENHGDLDEMNVQLKNLQMISSNDSPLKIPMRINTDKQKALEHLRELASNPSALERIQTLANNPNLIHEIKKIANQSFSEQLRTLPPFTPANLPAALVPPNSMLSEQIDPPVTPCSPHETAVTPSVNSIPHPACCADCPIVASNAALPHLRFPNRIDVDCETESNHDTALTLSCAGGHEELVVLLLQRGANIEHRDKKGFTPLILAATAGHASIVARLLDNGANIEAQSERTKDTALSLACSGGRQEVVDVLLRKGANREHRNVSDYTALSLAASGGYVNIIRLLLNASAEINSRTGSKLGITPLMLASMNGHVAAVKLLLDMGSDINAQIETNRNTALTLACFQGRAEVVSLLVDRKANIEHRAKTGLTPLMESASGGYVDVGRVLLERGADVNAPPVPTSKDTALTIAADKGHHKFVELLLLYGATIDVRNKKGATPLWLACNNGHLEVVQTLITHTANPDCSDSRKVSCLMATIRKGHIKVVKYLVRQVRQFPSDADCRRLISTITDKDLLKKCQTCMDQIIAAKERQAAEANEAASSLLKEIDLEKSREETRKVAAAKKREKRKAKKKGKQKGPAQTETIESNLDEPPAIEDEEPSVEELPPPVPTPPASPPPAPFTEPVEEDPRLSMVPVTKAVSPPPEPLMSITKQPNKKKTTTMTRKIERYQENLVSKTKQQDSTTPPAMIPTDDGWQEVIGKQKKVTIPHEQYSRVIGRGGTNLNVLREVTGASIDVENKRAIGDKTIVIKGNGDSIKHAYQLIMALLKNSESELMSLLPGSKSRSATVTSNHENDERTTQPSKGQTSEPIIPEIHVSAVASRSTGKKLVTPVKTPQPLTATGATWVNSNRSNRGTSSLAGNSNGSGSITVWNNPSSTTKPLPQPSKLMSSTHYPATTSSNSSYHYSYANSNQMHYGHSSKPSSRLESSTSTHLLSPVPLVPSQPGHRIPTSHSSTSSSDSISPPNSLLVVSGGYNPFASNLLTSSLGDVLAKPKEPVEESTTKMNFANVAKMNVQSKAPHHDPSSPPLPDPKIAPGYRGPSSAGTTPIHYPQTAIRFDPHSQLSRAPGANRHQQSISPSMSKVLLDQNGQNGSSATSSSSSSPSSSKAQTQSLISLDQQPKPFGPIGSHRMPMPATTDASFNENPLQMRTKFNRTLSANNAPIYQPTPTAPMMMNNPAYANLSRSRSNLNPSAPEFQHFHRLSTPFIPPNATAVSNGPVSSNIMNIARMMEQQQQPAAMYPVPPLPPRPTQPSDLETMQHVQNQVLHFFRMHANQQHVPPPPQLPTTLQIANILASKGQLPPDPNQAAALVAAYYYTNFISRTQQQPNAVPSSTSQTNGYETINALQATHSNSDEIPLDSINGQTGQVDPNMILANSNHSTGPPPPPSTNIPGDHKMVPAAIGSERKRHMPMGPAAPADWSSVAKQPYPIDPYLQQPIPLSTDYPPGSQARDYAR